MDRWIRQYRLNDLGRDLIAGTTLAAYVIPASMAYATLAGLPPQAGLYCYLVAAVPYAVFGTSRQAAVGPTSAMAMLIAATLGGMARTTRPAMPRWPRSRRRSSPRRASRRGC